MSLRTRRGLALAASFMFAATACGTGNVPSPSSSATAGGSASAGASSSASQGAASSDLTFLLDDDPSTFAGAPDDLPTTWVAGEVYSTLYGFDAKLSYLPSLADGAPQTSADGLTWTVKLKKGVKFHDGSPMTSADVKFSFDIVLSKNCTQNPDLCSAISDNVQSITAPDESTVVFQLKQKYAPFLGQGLGTVYILPKAAVEASAAKITQGASAAAADLKAAFEKVNTATNADACSAKTPPPSCDPGAYVSDMEAALTKAGVTLPDKAKYTDPKTSQLDPTTYGQALFKQLTDANTTAGATAVDAIAAALKLTDFARKPIGTGPFAFTSYQVGQKVTLTRFDDYFGGPTNMTPAQVKQLPAHAYGIIIKEAAAAVAALAKGDLNWVEKIESQDAYKQVKDNASLQFANYPDNGYYYIGFNMRPGHPYADKNLRTAFTMCIDHDKTVAAATDGNGIPVYADIPPFSWAFDPNVPKYTLDVAGAKKLIESSGWTLGSDGVYAKAGKKLSTKLYVRAGKPARIKFAQLAQNQLKACGISVDIVQGDLTTVLIPQVLDYPNNFETYLGGWSTAFDPDDYSIFHSSAITSKDNPSANNFVAWNNPQADQLLTQGRQELDQAKRKAIYFQFQTLIHDEAPYYFLWADAAHSGLTKSVHPVNGSLSLDTVGYYWNSDAWAVTPK